MYRGIGGCVIYKNNKETSSNGKIINKMKIPSLPLFEVDDNHRMRTLLLIFF